MGTPSDAELIERSWGEPETFAALFDRHAADIHHYVARRLGTSAADDLVAKTFLAAFRRRLSYDTSRTHARPWLYGIATTLIARHAEANSGCTGPSPGPGLIRCPSRSPTRSCAGWLPRLSSGGWPRRGVLGRGGVACARSGRLACGG